MKRFLALCCAMVAVLASIAIGTSLNNPANIKPVTDDTSQVSALNVQKNQNNEEIKSHPQSSATGYIVREQDGQVAVFQNGTDHPIQIIDVDLENLPETDRELLSQGIYAFDEAALQRLLEDYTG